MKKKKIYIVFTFIFAIILIYLSIILSNVLWQQILLILGSFLLTWCLDKLMKFVEYYNFKFLCQVIRNWNHKIRISFSYLIKIEIEGTYFLIRGNKIKGFQPVGGVYQVHESAKSTIRNIFNPEDEMKVDNEKDLRGMVKGKDLNNFLNWFNKNQDRETTCVREFKEELITTNIIDKDLFENTNFNYLGRHQTEIFESNYYSCGREFLLAHIYEINLTAMQRQAFVELKRKYDNLKDNSECKYAFVTEEEIHRRVTKKRKNGSYEMDINNHSYKILNGEYKYEL